ncbi:MAG: ChaN family lipoprotein [Chitinophagales bacterium]|nr:ChaN family lipoprotein [Hyphomicrobiales bacterium]
MKVFVFAALSALLPILLTSAVAAPTDPWVSWANPTIASHPLNGKIWSKEKAGFITSDELAGAVGQADMLLLGEYHDNADHHRLQAWLLQAFAKARASAGKPKPPVVFEMIRQEQAQTLRDYLAKPTASAEDLGAVIEWEKAGWPDWSIYLPIATAAFQEGLKIVPGDASRDMLHDASRQNLKPLSPDVKQRMALENPLEEPLQKALLDELFRGHCEMVAPALLAPMVDVQRYRDATLARNMIDAAVDAKAGSAVLIAGNGHVRKDRGVPVYLAKQSPSALKTITVMMAETQAGENDPAAFIAKNPDGEAATDFVWFTPGFQRPDPCLEFKRQMGRKP